MGIPHSTSLQEPPPNVQGSFSCRELRWVRRSHHGNEFYELRADLLKHGGLRSRFRQPTGAASRCLPNLRDQLGAVIPTSGDFRSSLSDLRGSPEVSFCKPEGYVAVERGRARFRCKPEGCADPYELVEVNSIGTLCGRSEDMTVRRIAREEERLLSW